MPSSISVIVGEIGSRRSPLKIPGYIATLEMQRCPPYIPMLFRPPNYIS